jgi:hypothetical protein
MVNLWISVSLLGLTGWQGYRLGRDYGWWGRSKAFTPRNGVKGDGPIAPKEEETRTEGLGHSRTDFNRLLTGYSPAPLSVDEIPIITVGQTNLDGDLMEELPITEPGTTLVNLAKSEPDEYPEETDQVPDACSWMDDEDEPLGEAEDPVGERVVALDEYVRRVKTVQKKMSQLSHKRQTDSTFMKHELGLLIQTYQLDNDHSLDWLFQQQGEVPSTDYGSVFDRIERLVG